MLLMAMLFAASIQVAESASPRERILFNTGWRFQLIEETKVMPIAEGQLLDGWRWRGVPGGTTEPQALAAPPSVGDSEWKDATPGLDVFGSKAGFAWYRIVLPKMVEANRMVQFASVDDKGTVFFNGKLLTIHQGWDEPFEAALDSAWKADGENILLVLVENVAGGGGMKEVRIFNRIKKAIPPQPAQSTIDHNDQSWEAVNLPHYGRLEAYDVSKHWQGLCWYRKTLVPTAAMKGRQVSIEFEGAMQLAQVWINGELRTTHAGGYLPFAVDLTADCTAGKPVTIAVSVDNRDNKKFVPGRPLGDMDFCYFSGIYRNVIVHVSDALRITDAVTERIVAGGGIFVTYPTVSKESATVQVQTHVRNGHGDARQVKIASTLIDRKGREVARSKSQAQAIAGNGDATVTQNMEVTQPELWHPDHPSLYTLKVQVLEGKRMADEQSLRVGIRHLAVDQKKGLMLNGEYVFLNGSNRHQSYPWVGNAMSDNGHYRDIRKLKEAGFNFLRLCHYPQSPAVMQACDELGILVTVCVPGWQFYNNSKEFNDSYVQAIQDMVRWHRNHPSALLWEVDLNESPMPNGLAREMSKLAHAEYPGDQLLTNIHDDAIPDRVNEIPYSGWDGGNFSRPQEVRGRMSLHREYGDFEFGGNGSTSRATRGDGEKAMLLMAWNYQWSCNKNISYPYTIGHSTWVGIDYNRGYSTRPCWCGVLDAVRLPKFLYYFFQSQRDPAVLRKDIASGPMVYIANYWSESSPNKVVVYSNCEEVELFLNGKSIAKRRPDSGPDTKYGEVPETADPLYWQKTGGKLPPVEKPGNPNVASFDGGNAKHLAHPPFTFPNLALAPGELKAVGYIGGRPVANFVRKTAGAAKQLALVFDLSGRELVADGADAVFVHAEMRDAAGTLVTTAKGSVSFAVMGDAVIIGGPRREVEAGVASVLVRAGTTAGKITVNASCEGLPPVSGTAHLRE
jgi:beta-galactosidase